MLTIDHGVAYSGAAGSPAEQHMHPLLIEDKLAQSQSYVDWMTQLHKTVLTKA